MTDKILKFMEEYHMLPENGNIVAGVSGGADSVCLLHALAKLRDALKLALTAVHVNHGIRPEAGEDAAFVEELCKRWEVPFVLVEEDVEALAEKERLSCEEAGRLVRYRAFGRTLARMDEGKEKRGCIAVAHNSDDRAETLLFHLLRGTGLAGMGSIRPVRENTDGSRIIRPLLSVSRRDIEAFLQKEGIPFRTDHTNAEEFYTRNKIRNRILPYAEKEICAQAKAHLVREAVLLADTADFVAARTQEAFGRCAEEDLAEGELRFEAASFRLEDPFLQDQMILNALRKLGSQKDMTAAHVSEVKKLFAPSCISGRRVALPVLRISVRRQFGQVIFKSLSGREKGSGGREDSAAGDLQGTVRQTEVPSGDGGFYVTGLGTVRTKILAGPGGNVDFAAFLKNIPEKKYTKWLDYDKIIESAIFRTRRTGDYLTINDSLDKKSLKRYMIEEKIPADRRDEMVLLADGAHVIWLVGYRISAAYKVTADTARILEVCCNSGKEADCGMDESDGCSNLHQRRSQE